MATILIFAANINAIESLKIGSDEWPPFHYKGESVRDVQGYTPIMVTSVLENMGVGISAYQIYPWARAVEKVFAGKLDALFTTTKTKGREEHCFFPKEPLIKFSYVFFVRKQDVGTLKFNTFDDLKSHKIGVIKGFSYTPEFMAFIKKEKNYEVVTKGEQNFKKLLAKRIDLVAVPLSVGYWQIKKLGMEGEVVPLSKSFSEDYLYIMFSKKTVDQAFVETFSEELKKYKASDTFKALALECHINY